MTTDPKLSDTARRKRDAAVAGHTNDPATARLRLSDEDAGVRATALGALQRLGALSPDELASAMADEAVVVRRRAAQVAASSRGGSLVALLADDPDVAETAAWALGERQPTEPGAVDALSAMACDHDDPICRESAVAALGAIGDPGGLPTILHGCTDKPTVRRRAVLALAPFEGPEVDAALAVAAEDRDWQVRQAAEDLLGPAT